MQGSYTTRAFRGTLNYREVGEDFNPELGFLPRDGYRYGQAFAMTYHRPEQFLSLREIRPHASYFEYRNIDTDFVQSAKLHLDTHFEWQDGMEFHPGFNWVKEGLEQPYEISPGIVVPAGTYSGWEAQWVFYTERELGRVVQRRGVRGKLPLRRPHQPLRDDDLPAELVAQRFAQGRSQRREPAPGRLRENVVGLRLSYFVTPSISIQSLTQYADRADIWSTNIRFGWLDQAGSGSSS
jgi:hypothetical protein